MPFHLNVKRFFLTYPRCELTKEEALEQLRRIPHMPDFYYLIGREAHADGGHHLHVYLEFTRAKHVRDERYFDLGDNHPNIQTVRNANSVQNYVTKDGDYIGNMDIGHVKRTYGEIVKSAASKEEFLVLLEDSYPRDLVLNLARIEHYCEYKFGDKQDDRVEVVEGTFTTPEVLDNWYEQNVRGNDDGKSRAGGAPVPSLLGVISPHAYWQI